MLGLDIIYVSLWYLGTRIFHWTKICVEKIGQETGPCIEDSLLQKLRIEEKYTVFH